MAGMQGTNAGTMSRDSKEAQQTWIYGSKLCQLVQSAAFCQALIQSSQLHFHLLVASISHVHLHHPSLGPHNLHHAQHAYHTMCCSASLLKLDKAEQQAPEATASAWQLHQAPARRMRI